MKANELRIGNLIHIPTTKQNAEICAINGLGYISVNNDYIGIGKLTIKDIEPILLSEEWLLKFGFKIFTDNYGKYFIRQSKRVKIRKDYRGFNFADRIQTLDYVHQLQNLHFELTGTELI